MRGAIPPLPNTPSWRGAQFKKEGTGTTLPFTFSSISGTESPGSDGIVLTQYTTEQLQVAL
jgi:hypothetical protein